MNLLLFFSQVVIVPSYSLKALSALVKEDYLCHDLWWIQFYGFPRCWEYVEFSVEHTVINKTFPIISNVQGWLWNKEEKELRSIRQGKWLWNAAYWVWQSQCNHDLMVAVWLHMLLTMCLDKTGNHQPIPDWWRAPRALPLSAEVLATHESLGRISLCIQLYTH